MDLAECGSEDETNTPTEKEPNTISLTPTITNAHTIPPMLTNISKEICVRAEWLRQSEHAQSERSETLRWRITPPRCSIPGVAVHIDLLSRFHLIFSHCPSPISNKHSGVVASNDHRWEWVHLLRACIGMAMQWVML